MNDVERKRLEEIRENIKVDTANIINAIDAERYDIAKYLADGLGVLADQWLGNKLIGDNHDN